MKQTFKWSLAQKAEINWWKRYLRHKDKDTYLSWKTGYWKDLLEVISSECPLEPGLEVLDAGCGPAGIFIALGDCKVDAVDPLLDNYAKSLSQFEPEDYPYVRFFNSALERYSPDKLYDIVFCMNAINHVSDIGLSYDLLVSWVKPGGKLVVTIDAHNHRFFRQLFRMIPGDILHPHQYDIDEYGSFLTDRNCRITQTTCLKKEFFFDHYVQVAEKSI